jgi:hypothetical protein
MADDLQAGVALGRVARDLIQPGRVIGIRRLFRGKDSDPGFE